MLDRPSTLVAQTLDVFHVNDPFNIAHIALRIAKRAQRPLVFTNHTRHDIYLEERWSSVLRPMLRLYVEAQMNAIMQASDLITAPSHSSLRWMQQLAPSLADRMRVVHNGVPLQRFEQIPADVLRREQLGIGAEATIFGYVGRVSPEKNLEVFAEAFVRAVQQGADAHWVVVGDGSSRAELEAITAPVSERVHFLGRVLNEALPRYIPLFDVFGMPSLSDTNPLSVTERWHATSPLWACAPIGGRNIRTISGRASSPRTTRPTSLRRLYGSARTRRRAARWAITPTRSAATSISATSRRSGSGSIAS